MKNVSGEALGVNSHQRRRGVNIPHHQSDGFLRAAASIRAGFGTKAINPKLTPTRRKIRGCELLN